MRFRQTILHREIRLKQMKKKTALLAGAVTLAATALFGGVFALLGSFRLPVLTGLAVGFGAACLCLFLFYRAANVTPEQKNWGILLFFSRWAVAVAVIALSLLIPAVDSVAVILPLTVPVLAAAVLMGLEK